MASSQSLWLYPRWFKRTDSVFFGPYPNYSQVMWENDPSFISSCFLISLIFIDNIISHQTNYHHIPRISLLVSFYLQFIAIFPSYPHHSTPSRVGNDFPFGHENRAGGWRHQDGEWLDQGHGPCHMGFLVAISWGI